MKCSLIVLKTAPLFTFDVAFSGVEFVFKVGDNLFTFYNRKENITLFSTTDIGKNKTA